MRTRVLAEIMAVVQAATLLPEEDQVEVERVSLIRLLLLVWPIMIILELGTLNHLFMITIK